MAKTAIVYVDGFNLYYTLFRAKGPGQTPLPPHLKWLNPYALAECLLPQYGVVRVEYFTARIKQKYAKGDEASRQRAYLGALEATPKVTVTYGNYQVAEKWRPLAEPIPGYIGTHAKVVEIREKRSDVNLACSMLVAAARHEADAFILISNDSDFRPLLETVGTAFGATAGVLCPAPNINESLLACSRIAIRIRQHHLEVSQLPDCVRSPKGRSFDRPAEWAAP